MTTAEIIHRFRLITARASFLARRKATLRHLVACRRAAGWVN